MNEVLHYLVTFVLQAAAFMFVARFLLQVCRVDFYNPVSQGVVKVTDPVLRPLRRVLPGFSNIDLAALVTAIATQVLLLMALAALRFHGPTPVGAGVSLTPDEHLRLYARWYVQTRHALPEVPASNDPRVRAVYTALLPRLIGGP